jgi:single-strand DNA-binding protein
MNLNKVLLVGRLGKDPELKAMPNGGHVCTFSLATSKVWKDRETNESKEDTEWHNIVFFNKSAENVSKYVAKGSLLLVEGHLKTRSWEDKDTQKKMYRTEVIGDTFQLAPRSSGSGNSSEQETEKAYNSFGKNDSKKKPKKSNGEVDTIEYPEEDIDPSDIPF